MADQLSKRVETKQKEISMYEKGWKDKVDYFIDDLQNPSLKSIGIIFLIPLIIFILTNFYKVLPYVGLNNVNLLSTPYYTIESNHFQNLIAIHAGIGAIIFAMFILVAESLRDNDNKDAARVLLKESFLFPLTISEIAIFFQFLFFDVTWFSAFSIFIMGVVTSISVYRIIRVLLSKVEFRKKRIELLKGRLKKSISLDIKERIGSNIFQNQINNTDIQLEYYFQSLLKENEYYFIYANTYGAIVDINFDLLKRISKIVDIEGVENGIVWGNIVEQTDLVVEEGKDFAPREAKKNEMIRDKQRYILASFKQSISEGNDALLAFHKPIIKNPQILEEINSLAQKAFIVKPKDTFADEVRAEIAGVKDEFLSAIKNNQIGVIEELSEIYVKLAEGYLELLSDIGGGFSSEQARSERTTFQGGFEQIRWLSTDIRTLFLSSIKTQDMEIVYRIAGLSINISRRALQRHDHYLFQEFIYFPELFYRISKRDDNTSEIKEYLLGRSWRFLKELSDYYIKPGIEKTSSLDEKTSYIDFAIHVLMAYQNLLIKAFDGRDIDSFIQYQSVVLSLFRRFDFEEESYFEEIEIQKKVMLFGVAGWIYHNYSLENDNEDMKNFYLRIESVFSINLSELIEIYLKAHTFETENFWHWDRWESKPDGVVRSIKILDYVEEFFVVKSLNVMSSMNLGQLLQIELSDYRYLANQQSIQAILDRVRNSFDEWEYIVSINNNFEVFDNFKNWMEEIKSRYEEIERNRVIETPISQEKVAKFQKAIKKGFYESSKIRDILAFYNKVQLQLQKTSEETNGLIISEIGIKEPFIEDQNVHYYEWGEHYGRSMAQGESSKIVQEIEAKSELINLERLEVSIKSFDNPEEIIILLVNISDFIAFREHYEFLRETNGERINGLVGHYKFEDYKIPVFEIFQVRAERQALILDKRKIESLIQYSPLFNIDDDSNIHDIFYISVKAYSEDEELLTEIINNPPEWLEEQHNTQEEMEAYLQEKALVDLSMRFEINILEDYLSFRILFPRE